MRAIVMESAVTTTVMIINLKESWDENRYCFFVRNKLSATTPIQPTDLKLAVVRNTVTGFFCVRVTDLLTGESQESAEFCAEEEANLCHGWLHDLIAREVE